MKAVNYLPFVIVFTILLSSQLLGISPKNNAETEIPQNSIDNLILGIQSENCGLCRSCIYYVGKYKIDEAVNSLIERVRKESNPHTRILIAISLYQIGNKHGIFELDRMGYNDPDEYVKEICRNIYNEYLANEYGYNI